MRRLRTAYEDLITYMQNLEGDLDIIIAEANKMSDEIMSELDDVMEMGLVEDFDNAMKDDVPVMETVPIPRTRRRRDRATTKPVIADHRLVVDNRVVRRQPVLRPARWKYPLRCLSVGEHFELRDGPQSGGKLRNCCKPIEDSGSATFTIRTIFENGEAVGARCWRLT